LAGKKRKRGTGRSEVSPLIAFLPREEEPISSLLVEKGEIKEVLAHDGSIEKEKEGGKRERGVVFSISSMGPSSLPCQERRGSWPPAPDLDRRRRKRGGERKKRGEEGEEGLSLSSS